MITGLGAITPVGNDAPSTWQSAVDGRSGIDFIRSFDAAWKVKRMRRNPVVEVAPSTFCGKPKGPPSRFRARQLEGDEAAHAADLIETKHPILQGILVPLGHRLKRLRTLHFELTPLGA